MTLHYPLWVTYKCLIRISSDLLHICSLVGCWLQRAFIYILIVKFMNVIFAWDVLIMLCPIMIATFSKELLLTCFIILRSGDYSSFYIWRYGIPHLPHMIHEWSYPSQITDENIIVIHYRILSCKELLDNLYFF